MGFCTEVVGYACQEACDVFCADCGDSKTMNPIFGDNEFDDTQHCCECGEELDIRVLPQKSKETLEENYYKNLDLDDDEPDFFEETEEPDHD